MNKKVLVTAGPTWVPIDAVRVISNISSGQTGVVIAQRAAKAGAQVTLLLGPVDAVDSRRSTVDSLKIIRFKYFDELQKLIEKQLKRQKYDILIHTAAVSDYKPVKIFQQKIKSEIQDLLISLRPTAKLIDKMRLQAPDAFLVMFKLEIGKSRNELIKIAHKSMLRSKADLAVANNLDGITKNRHRAYILDSTKRITAVNTKKELANKLFNVIAERL